MNAQSILSGHLGGGYAAGGAAIVMALLAIVPLRASADQGATTTTARAVPTVKLNKEGHIMEISLSYFVSTAGLDLATDAGAQALEQRMRGAADAVCKEIGHQYTRLWPNDQKCAEAAMDQAKPKARELIRSAQEKAASKKPSG